MAGQNWQRLQSSASLGVEATEAGNRPPQATEAGNRPLAALGGDVPPLRRAPPAEPEPPPPPAAAPAAGGPAARPTGKTCSGLRLPAEASAVQAAGGQAESDSESESEFERPEYPATEVPAAERPSQQFRIGPMKNGFVYTGSLFSFMNHPVYVCDRGSGVHPVDVFWLYRCAGGAWLCVEAYTESQDPIRDGAPQFKTQGDDIDDISVNRDALAWRYWDELRGEWSSSTMMPPTTRL